MKSDSIKLELIEWLNQLNDNSVLTSLLQFKKASDAGDWYDNLTPSQLKALQRGMKDIENGNTLTSKEFWASYGRTL